MNTKNTLIAGTVIVVVGVVFLAIKNRQNSLQESIAEDSELTDLIIKIDNASK